MRTRSRQPTRGWARGLLAVLVAAALGLPAALAADKPPKKKPADEFVERFKAVDQTDEKALQDLAAWCVRRGLKTEEQRVRTRLLEVQYQARHAEFAAVRTEKSFQALLAWCRQSKLDDHAAELQREWFLPQYAAKATTTPADSAPANLALATWCQAQALYPQAVRHARIVLKLDAKNAAARRLLADGAKQCQSKERGLLRHQPVPGYPGPNCWYHVWVPADHVPAKPLPLYVWLHGGHVGAGSADNTVDLCKIIPEFKAGIALFPNHQYHFWTHPRELTYALETIQDVMLRFTVDPQRIYIMGSSMGGSGAWALAANFPELFAACSPNSAWWEFTPIEKAAVMPIYINHGSQDQTVPVTWGRDAFAKLKNLPGAKIEYHEGNFGHQAPIEALAAAAKWLAPFANPRTFDWDELIARARTLPPPPWVNQPQYQWPDTPPAPPPPPAPAKP